MKQEEINTRPLSKELVFSLRRYFALGLLFPFSLLLHCYSLPYEDVYDHKNLVFRERLTSPCQTYKASSLTKPTRQCNH